MTRKIPPPPPIANQDQTFNRWLLELTSILNNDGGIDPGSVAGLSEVIAQSAANALAIAALQEGQAGQAGTITALQDGLIALANQVGAISDEVATLTARAQVRNGVVDPAPGLGSVNDWYANTAGAAGHRIFVKTGVATWTAFPF